MHLNQFADSSEPLDLTQSDEFASLLASAADLGIPPARPARSLSRNTVLNHLRLHFLEWGEPAAPPLLLLHGVNQSAHSWDLVSLQLADRYHVYALDQRGHGDSEWAHNADYSSAALAADALALIRQEGMERPLLLGHSLGGRVALTLAVAEPSLPRALVIVDTGPHLAAEGVRMIRRFMERNLEFDSIAQFIDRVVGYDPFRSRAHMERTARYNLIHRADGKYVSKSDRLLHDPDFRARQERRAPPFPAERMGEIPCPVLVVRGEESKVLEATAAQAFVAQLPQGSLVTVPRCGHNVASQNTSAFLAAIRPFLDSL